MPAPCPEPTDGASPAAAGSWRMAEHWPELVAALTRQSVDAAERLLRGLDLLVRRGRLSEAERQVLAQPAERLRQAGMLAQQIVRFQSGLVRQSHEKIDLAHLLECVLQERRDELARLGLAVWRKFEPVEVLIDPTLAFSLGQAMLDWSLPFGQRIDLRLQRETPTGARLTLKTYGEADPDAVLADSLHWLLLRQIAATDGAIGLERRLVEDGVLLGARFGRTPAAAEANPAGA